MLNVNIKVKFGHSSYGTEWVSAIYCLVIHFQNILLSGILEGYILAGDLGDANGDVQCNGDAFEGVAEDSPNGQIIAGKLMHIGGGRPAQVMKADLPKLQRLKQ